jgi:hypothetical protein
VKGVGVAVGRGVGVGVAVGETPGPGPELDWSEPVFPLWEIVGTGAAGLGVGLAVGVGEAPVNEAAINLGQSGVVSASYSHNHVRACPFANKPVPKATSEAIMTMPMVRIRCFANWDMVPQVVYSLSQNGGVCLEAKTRVIKIKRRTKRTRIMKVLKVRISFTGPPA